MPLPIVISPFRSRRFDVSIERNRVDIVIGNHIYFIVWGHL